MKQTVIVIICLLFITLSCRNREREKQLDAKEAELNEREQQLLLREKTLDFREQEISDRRRIIDSIRQTDSIIKLTDSLAAQDTIQTNPALTGEWTVKMTCIETSCPGSAIGDTRIEQWNLSYQGQHIVAKAKDRGNLVRTYSGNYTGDILELIEHRDTSMVYDTRMVVRLRVHDNNTIEGQREIIRSNECKIVYAVSMNKQ